PGGPRSGARANAAALTGRAGAARSSRTRSRVPGTNPGGSLTASTRTRAPDGRPSRGRAPRGLGRTRRASRSRSWASRSAGGSRGSRGPHGTGRSSSSRPAGGRGASELRGLHRRLDARHPRNPGRDTGTAEASRCPTRDSGRSQAAGSHRADGHSDPAETAAGDPAAQDRPQSDSAEDPPEASPPASAAALDVLHATVGLRGGPAHRPPRALGKHRSDPASYLAQSLGRTGGDTRTHVRVCTLVKPAPETVGTAVAELDASGVRRRLLVDTDHTGEGLASPTAVEAEHAEVPADLEPAAAAVERPATLDVRVNAAPQVAGPAVGVLLLNLAAEDFAALRDRVLRDDLYTVLDLVGRCVELVNVDVGEPRH